MTCCRAILILYALCAWSQDYNLTSTEVAKLEKALDANPEETTARARLLGYYARRSNQAARAGLLRHIGWLIDNHPESPLLNQDSVSLKPSDFAPPHQEELEAISSAWEVQVERHPNNVAVLANAVKNLDQVSYGLPSDCLKRLRQVEPTNPRWVVLLASLYDSALTSSNLAQKALPELQTSTDLPVVGMAGQGLYTLSRKVHSEQMSHLAESLLKQAQSLDPLNPRWSTTAAEKPALLTERDMWPYGKVPAMPIPDDALRLVAESQAGKVIHRVQPRCTPAPNVACPTRPEKVKLGVLIAKDGTVKMMWAWSGDMSTIPAAMDAVRQWTYRKTIITGEYVEVATEVEVVLSPAKQASPPSQVKSSAPGSGGGFVPPVAISKVDADYSPEAHALKFEGSVQISLVVDEQGLPRDLKVVRGVGMGLDEKALEAVRKWKFRPGTKDGKPMAVPATVEVQFKAR